MHYVIKTKAHWIAKAEAGNRAKLHSLLQPGLSGLWPLGRDNDSKLWPYVIACLEVVLTNPEAASEYAEIVDSMNSEGWQGIIRRIKETSGTQSLDWVNNAAQSWAKGESNIPMISVVDEAYEQYKNYLDIREWESTVKAFIAVFFNRKENVENFIFKVNPNNKESQLLCDAVAFRAVIDYFQLDIADLRRYRNTEINEIMTAPEWPKYRTHERDIRSTITNIHKREGFKRTADDTFLAIAEKWYKSRVECNLLREAADYYRLDPTDLSKRIRPCDDAVGYPCHK